jgi:hypothetical protein
VPIAPMRANENYRRRPGSDGPLEPPQVHVAGSMPRQTFLREAVAAILEPESGKFLIAVNCIGKNQQNFSDAFAANAQA